MNIMIISREDLSTPSDLATDTDASHTVWLSDSFSSSSGVPIDMQPVPEQPEAWVGSAGHEKGECIPCIWVHNKFGCRTGAACEYCHLCEKGAFKKRKQEKAAKAWLETRQTPKAAAVADKTTAAPHHAQPATASHQQPQQQQQQQQEEEEEEEQQQQEQQQQQQWCSEGRRMLSL